MDIQKLIATERIASTMEEYEDEQAMLVTNIMLTSVRVDLTFPKTSEVRDPIACEVPIY